MTARAHVLVVGAGYAGVLAARRLARAAGARARVTLLNPAPDFVERIRLHQVAAGWAPPRRAIEGLLHGSGARLRLGRALRLDLAARRVLVDDGGPPTWLDVDQLVLAAGSATRATVPGVAAHAHRLDTPAGARALGAAVRAAAAAGRRLVVVGGGLTAIEAVSELTEAVPGLRAALVCRGALGEGALGAAAVRHVRDALAGRAVEVIEHAPALAVEPGAVVSGAGLIHAGAVLWTAGFAASPLAAEAGLAVDGAGRMLVDEHLGVPAAPWVWGAGDAAVPAAPVGAPLHMSCKVAMPMAARLADNLAAVLRGAAPRRFRFGDTGVCVSLGRRDGVIQLRDAAGVARGVIRNRAGAWVKERVCRFTISALVHPRVQVVFRSYQRRGAAVLAARAPAALPAASAVTSAPGTEVP